MVDIGCWIDLLPTSSKGGGVIGIRCLDVKGIMFYLAVYKYSDVSSLSFGEG